MGYIHTQAERIVKRYQTRNPFELLDAIGAITRYSYEYKPDGLKGFSAILNNVKFAVINGNLTEHDRRIVAGHEAAHLILHKDEIKNTPTQTLKDFTLYDNSGRLEYQANSFLADFLVSDEDVLNALTYDDHDFFSNAKELCIPPHLLAFKLHSMMRRDYKVRNPIELKGSFLGGGKDLW